MALSELGRLNRFDRDISQGITGDLAGVDEAGRGPLAGPVVAAAVILLHIDGLEGLNDSKKVSSQRRERLYPLIFANAVVGIGIVEEEQIDLLNIYQATRLAMKKAVLALKCSPALVIIDGKMKIDIPFKQTAFVRGDSLSASIAAASIVAKVYRDQRMTELDRIYPVYGFAKHKGYGTAVHMAKLKEWGPCPAHRKSFAPVQKYKTGDFIETIA